jgi:hypothetical protein
MRLADTLSARERRCLPIVLTGAPRKSKAARSTAAVARGAGARGVPAERLGQTVSVVAVANTNGTLCLFKAAAISPTGRPSGLQRLGKRGQVCIETRQILSPENNVRGLINERGDDGSGFLK